VKIRRADLADARDRDAIDRFVADHPDAELFHRPQWSRAIERGCGARGHYLVLEGKGGALRGLLPLSEVRSPLFGNSMVSVGFGIGGGIIADDADGVERLGEAGWALARERGCTDLELRGGSVPPGPWKLVDDVYAAFAGELPSGDEAILLSIRRRQRALVRHALDDGFEYRAGNAAADLDSHFRTYSVSMRNHGTPMFPRRLFQAMAAEFGEQAEIVTAWKEGTPVCSVFSFYFKGCIYPYWVGSTSFGRRQRADAVTYYEMMRRASRRGCTRVDFGRSKVGTGPYEFKLNWGLEPRPLVYAVRTAAGASPRAINPLDPRYQRRIALWRKLPVWAANLIGPPIARGLG
jgi:FemAB-related protein (PEP-CTERM system-associated)